MQRLDFSNMDPYAVSLKVVPDPQSIIRLQAQIRGLLLRKAFITPTELSSHIKAHITGLTDEKCQEVSQRVSALLVFSIQDPQIQTVRHSLADQENPFDLEVQIRNYCAKLIFAPKVKIGSGGFKEVFAAKRITLTLPNQVDSRFEVLMKVNGFEAQKCVLKGIENQKKLIALCPHARIMPAPRRLLPKNPTESSEWLTQSWMNSSLSDAIKNSEIPLSPFSDSHTVSFHLEDTMSVFIDISEVLEDVHRNGFVHRDVKLDNILVDFEDLNDESIVSGFLTDFDLVHIIGYSHKLKNYFAWDSATMKGYVTPFCDIYGLTIAIAIGVLGYTMEISNWRERLLDVQTQKASLDVLIIDLIEKFFKENASLLPKEVHLKFKDSHEALAHITQLIEDHRLKSNDDMISKLENIMFRLDIKRQCFDLLIEVFKKDYALIQAFNNPKLIPFDESQYTLSHLFCSQDSFMRDRAMEIIHGIIGPTKEFTDRLREIFKV